VIEGITEAGTKEGRERRDLIGVVLDERYKLESLRNQGGMGEIWNASDLKFSQACLVKLLPSGMVNDATHSAALIREAQLTKSLPSELTPFVGDMGTSKGITYYVMDLLPGTDLGTLLDKEFPSGVSLSEFVPLLSKLLEAVAALHAAGVIHRDLKPDNIFVQYSDDGAPSVRVIDFGVAQSSSEDFEALDERVFPSTAHFTPPECRLQSMEPSTHAGDVFAIGLIAYRMILGGHHFEELDYEKFYAEKSPLPSLHEHPAGKTKGLNAAVGQVLSNAVAHDVSQRYPDAASMLLQLRSATEFHPGNISPGTILDESYRVLGFFDKGGMGAVYFVEDAHRPTKEKLLLKILSAPAGQSEKATRVLRQRFRTECQTLHTLKHPAIPFIHYNGSHNNVPFLVMQQAAGDTFGRSFDKLLKKGGWPAVFRMARQVADALDEVHAKDIIHRDIKPSNIVVDPETEKAVVLDFGIARLKASKLTGANTRIGTPGFTSPEQLDCKAVFASDQWSFAACFYALLTNIHPGRHLDDEEYFKGAELRDMLLGRIASDEVLPLSDVPKRIETPPGVVAAITKAMSFDHKDRFESVTAFVEAMEKGTQDVPAPILLPAHTDVLLQEWLGPVTPPTAETPLLLLTPSSKPEASSIPSTAAPSFGSATEQIPKSSSRISYLGLALATSAAIAVGVYILWGRGGEPPAVAMVKPPAPEPVQPVFSASKPDDGTLSRSFSVRILAQTDDKPVEGIEARIGNSSFTLPSETLLQAGSLVAVVVDPEYAGSYACAVSSEAPTCMLRLVRTTTQKPIAKRRPRGRKVEKTEESLIIDFREKRDPTEPSLFIHNTKKKP